MLSAVLLAGTLVLAVVVAADRVLALLAARRVARRVAAAVRAQVRPEVRVAGGPFLVQLAVGVYREVGIELGAFTAAGIDFSGVTARLTRVRAPLRRLLAGDGPTAARMTATATIPLAALGRRLPGDLTLRAAGSEVRICGTLLRVPVTGTLGIRAESRRIALTPRVTGVPALVGFVIALPALPAQLTISSVRVAGTGLEVNLSGTDVRLTAPD